MLDLLVTRQLARALARHAAGFPALVTGQHCEMEHVKAARLEVAFDLAGERPAEDAPGANETPYVLSVEIEDDRGKAWHAELRGWCRAGRSRTGLLLRQKNHG